MAFFSAYRHNRAILLGFVAAVGTAVVVLMLRDLPALRLAAAADKIGVIRDIPYGQDLKEYKRQLDLYAPKKAHVVPVVIFVHGGFWRAGDRRYYQAATGLYANVGTALAKNGVLTVVPSYRLQPAVSIEDQLQDIESVILWTRNNIQKYGGDPEAIFLMGHSAGGHLISLLGTDSHYYRAAGINPDWIMGYMPISGIFDLAHMAADNDSKFNDEITYRLFGRDAAVLSRYSPDDYVTIDMKPFLIMDGGRDLPFIAKQSKMMAERLMAQGNAVVHVTVPADTHQDMVMHFNSAEDDMTGHILRFIGMVLRRRDGASGTGPH